MLFFLLLIGCVVAETYGYGSSDPTLANPGAKAVEQLDRALLKVQSGNALCWTRLLTSSVQVVDARVLGKLDKRNGSRKAWPNCSFVMKAHNGTVNKQLSEISTDVVSNVQLEGVQLYFSDHVVQGKSDGSHRKCSTRLQYEGVATSLSGVFPEEGCKVGSDEDGGAGSFVGHERCGGEAGDTMDANAILKSSSESASKGSGRSEDSGFVC